MAARGRTIPMRNVPSSTGASALWLNLAALVLAALYSTMSVTFAVCDWDAEVVVTVTV